MALRMFTAVLPPHDVIVQLDQLLEPRRLTDPALRWTRPEGWHLTTAFMATVELSQLDRLTETLSEVSGRTMPFTVGVDGGVCFPHPVKARILAMDVRIGSQSLAALSQRCRNAATRAGVEVDGAKFHGHLTLARHNRGFQATKWLGVLDSFPTWSWSADRLCLVESQPRRGYTIVEEFPLTAAD